MTTDGLFYSFMSSLYVFSNNWPLFWGVKLANSFKLLLLIWLVGCFKVDILWSVKSMRCKLHLHCIVRQWKITEAVNTMVSNRPKKSTTVLLVVRKWSKRESIRSAKCNVPRQVITSLAKCQRPWLTCNNPFAESRVMRKRRVAKFQVFFCVLCHSPCFLEKRTVWRLLMHRTVGEIFPGFHSVIEITLPFLHNRPLVNPTLWN